MKKIISIITGLFFLLTSVSFSADELTIEKQLVGIIGNEEFRNFSNILMFANKYMESLQTAHITIGLSLWDTNYRLLMSIC